MKERFKTIKNANTNAKIINKRKKKLGNGKKVYFSTLKRNTKKIGN
ncbi:hypothetical protein [Virgibacillus siamensis]|nr:hypothetical protein [Virgibacillus siamensis]